MHLFHIYNFYKRNAKVIESASKEIYHLAYNCLKKTKLTLFRENELASLKSAKYAKRSALQTTAPIW